jgi:hypothetical protein
MQGTLLLVKLLIYCGDLAGSFGATSEECCESYRKAETILLEQVGIITGFFPNILLCLL